MVGLQAIKNQQVAAFHLNRFRINQSKKLLLEDRDVTEAYYESGFANISYFNKIFKKIAGENPSAFKKKYVAT